MHFSYKELNLDYGRSDRAVILLLILVHVFVTDELTRHLEEVAFHDAAQITQAAGLVDQPFGIGHHHTGAVPEFAGILSIATNAVEGVVMDQDERVFAGEFEFADANKGGFDTFRHQPFEQFSVANEHLVIFTNTRILELRHRERVVIHDGIEDDNHPLDILGAGEALEDLAINFRGRSLREKLSAGLSDDFVQVADLVPLAGVRLFEGPQTGFVGVNLRSVFQHFAVLANPRFDLRLGRFCAEDLNGDFCTRFGWSFADTAPLEGSMVDKVRREGSPEVVVAIDEDVGCGHGVGVVRKPSIHSKAFFSTQQ